jgi:hypothetical protein
MNFLSVYGDKTHLSHNARTVWSQRYERKVTDELLLERLESIGH